uniref:Groucho/TLE N-terminal Q-rich domain-containing protein n=1 Tax=Scleropages formosus TaxID=113540 RepID=A0A8C9VS76_SCLFO
LLIVAFQSYERSYGLNVEMRRQTEISKRLNRLCSQMIPYLPREHQQRLLLSVESAKQVSAADVSVGLGVCGLPSACGVFNVTLPPPQEGAVSRIRSSSCAGRRESGGGRSVCHFYRLVLINLG